MVKIPTDADMLPPSDDHIFKTLLTHPDAKPVLINVISTVIERPVVDVLVRNTELPAMDTDEKAERLDVNCVINGGDQVNVEMQASRIEEIAQDHMSFKNKSVYYLTDLHSSQSSKGVKYHNFVRTYQATFCTYTVLPALPDFVNRFSLRTPDGEEFCDQLNMIIIELSKLNDTLKKPVKGLSPLEMWSLFFQFAPDLKYRNLINDIISYKKEIGMATALLMEISRDEQERARFRSRRMFETDVTSNLLTAEARGEAKKAVEVAKKLKAVGVDISIIVNSTGLTADEIQRL